MFNFKCNMKKSPYDKRDCFYHSTSNNFPQTLDMRKDLRPVRNQGKQGSCYAQSAATMKEWQEKMDNGFDEYMSPQFFYNNRPNKYDNDPNNDDGMYGRDVMKILMKIGICKEYDYPYGKIENKKDISNDNYEKAKQYRI